MEVELKHEVRNGMNWWERAIHTPAGTMHDIKRSLIVAQGSGSGPEIVKPLIKDLKTDLRCDGPPEARRNVGAIIIEVIETAA